MSRFCESFQNNLAQNRPHTRKLLIIHQGALGDFVATFPCLVLLRNRWDSMDGLCQSQLGKLACHLKIIDRHFSIENRMFSSLYAGPADPRVKELLSAYSEIILFSFSNDLCAKLRSICGSKVHCIPPRARPDQRIHVGRHIFDHLCSKGLIDRNARPFRAAQVEVFPNRSHLIIHPGSGSSKKCWPLANFMHLEKRLKSMQMHPEYLLGPAELAFKEKLNTSDDRVIHVADDLIQVVALLEKAAGYIGNDSGISHLAGFLNIPAVVIFGPSDPLRWRPAGQRVRVLRSRPDCVPCFEKKPSDQCLHAECLLQTTPEIVMDEIMKLLY